VLRAAALLSGHLGELVMIVRSYREQATLVTTLIPAGRTYGNKYDFNNLSLTTSACILLDRYRSPVILALKRWR
jgi:hypothetical protein